MDESPQDLDDLQALLDRSYGQAGDHLRSIHTDKARVDAKGVVEMLDGMQVSVVATVASDGRPRTGPVDSFFYRGRWHFGTAPNAVRTKHLDRNPGVSLTHVRGETLVVTVHGTARRLDLDGANADFKDVLRGWYGAEWDSWPAGVYFAVDANRMFAADMSVHTAGS